MSQESQRVHLELDRTPLHGMDLDDDARVRDYLCNLIESSVALLGRLDPTLIYLGDDQHERGSIRHLDELGQEPMLALLFRSGADRPGIVRAFRQGERLVGEPGALRRAAALLEHVIGTERWWLTWRTFGQGEASVGVFHGAWQRLEGEGMETLPEPFREWLDTGAVELESKQFGEGPPGPVEDLRMAVAGVTGDLPADPRHVAQVLGSIVDAELLAKPLDALYIFAFRPGALERWELRGKLRVPLDDLVRAISAQGPTEALAVLHPAVFERDGVTHRCVVTVVERLGRKGVRLVPFRVEAGRLAPMEPIFRDEGPVGPDGLWIGVEPKAAIDLSSMGPIDAPGFEVPEA